MPSIINPLTITTLHSQCIIQWKTAGIKYQYQEFLQLVEENHAFNFQLWHAEDRARREDMGYEFVYHAKREIDSCNQQRNNRMEAMDAWLFNRLNPASPECCPVNSESPGMIIDRLSILSLKAYHMALQTERQDVTEEHRKTCTSKLHVIHQQLEQLTLCLEQFLNEIENKNRTFRIYHQFKMYNDPSLNPELYCQK
ncbi:DUF4254 domain-containing protein [Legionella fallonii]|uniref:DUF4254 domain-containing protein n=1 Tax=Legionella fallonii LLAP-10 TaxID=1212491 RepID=A0A098G0V3_9GAMM|nr:DUF4254 domain-containing protein [Legionella fallonii]CEG55591.1 conserved protein of unknown function [Legionella fallonii LLAP-10]